jgi:hypothetical protein
MFLKSTDITSHSVKPDFLYMSLLLEVRESTAKFYLIF